MPRFVLFALALSVAVTIACIAFAVAAESGRRAIETFRRRRTSPLVEAAVVLGLVTLVAGAVFGLNATHPSPQVSAPHAQVVAPDEPAKGPAYRTDGGR